MEFGGREGEDRGGSISDSVAHKDGAVYPNGVLNIHKDADGSSPLTVHCYLLLLMFLPVFDHFCLLYCVCVYRSTSNPAGYIIHVYYLSVYLLIFCMGC